MRRIQTEVLVIGGGATGTGILRDLAMRGFKATLVEKRDLAHGTTGRYHGLLHSGGRYVVKDPQAAVECIEENRILRRIMPHCIEDTGGFFVTTTWDDPGYALRFLEGCQEAGIPVEEISISQMLRVEPWLNPQISRCFRVPDATADSWLAADSNVESARQHGAESFTYHEVLKLLRSGDRVTGALCRDLVKDEEVQMDADLVINASGAWAGMIAATIGLLVQIKPGKGTMVAINHRFLRTVVNRCKMPSDGDILVPIHTVTVIGTTDVQVGDPERFAIEPWEVQLMLEEGEKLVPGFQSLRMLRAWAGVRPLYQETQAAASRDITRAYVLLDHEIRDGISGLLTITSGKWTTYRKMAEATVDQACKILKVQRPCRTHLEALPGAKTGHYHPIGMRLAEIEKSQDFGQLICECELATYPEIVRAITHGAAKTIDDVRRDTRLGMGPCQGGFCTYRVAGILHELHQPPVEETNVALRDFLQERWKGVLPVLWGQQLRQERLDELVYLDVLNADHLPGPTASRLGPVNYEPASQGWPESMTGSYPVPSISGGPPGSIDLVVVGAGLSGLAAAWQVCVKGKRARVVSKGRGALYWGSGCIDVLGYLPGILDQPVVADLPAALRSLVHENPQHPYALAGLDQVGQAITIFQSLCLEAGYPLHGSLERNWLLPTALGTLRPTCLAPESMIGGDCSPWNGKAGETMVLVGFEGFYDFFPDLMAANLNAQGIPARAFKLVLPSLWGRRFVTSRTLAELFERTDFRQEVIRALRPSLASGPTETGMRVGFPAVLGSSNSRQVYQDLKDQLGCTVFEIPGLPPSVPGIRLYDLLVAAIERRGGQVYDGMQVCEAETGDRQVHTVWTEAAARQKAHRAQQFILATGGLLGGGLSANPQGVLSEIVFHLPVKGAENRLDWFRREFLAPEGHTVFQAGLAVNGQFQPVDASGQVLYDNLYAIGSILAGADPLRERSLEGIALTSGYVAGGLVSAH